MSLLGDFWSLTRRIDAVLNVQDRFGNSLDNLEERLRVLEDRVTRREASHTFVAVEARAAAATASSAAAGAMLGDLVTRITRLEVRAEGPAPALPPPAR